jgi:hypothetical protein
MVKCEKKIYLVDAMIKQKVVTYNKK